MSPQGGTGAQQGQPGTGWRVTGQQERVGDDGTGTIREGVVVMFVTQHNVHGTVFVPKARYTPAAVKDAVTAAAAQLDQVARLTG